MRKLALLFALGCCLGLSQYAHAGDKLGGVTIGEKVVTKADDIDVGNAIIRHNVFIGGYSGMLVIHLCDREAHWIQFRVSADPTLGPDYPGRAYRHYLKILEKQGWAISPNYRHDNRVGLTKGNFKRDIELHKDNSRLVLNVDDGRFDTCGL